MEKIQKALYDFNATLKAHPEYTENELLKKFPEFGNDKTKLKAAYDYSATIDSGKYNDTSEFNYKFPELFNVPYPSRVVEKATDKIPSFVNHEETPLTKEDIYRMGAINAQMQEYEPSIPNNIQITPKSVIGKSVGVNDYAAIVQRNPEALKNIILPPEAQQHLEDNKIITGYKQDNPEVSSTPTPVYGIDANEEKRLREYYASDPQGKKEYDQFLNKLDSYKYQLEDSEKRLKQRESEIRKQYKEEIASAPKDVNNPNPVNDPNELNNRIAGELSLQKKELKNAKNIIDAYQQGKYEGTFAQMWGEIKRKAPTVFASTLSLGLSDVKNSLDDYRLTKKFNEKGFKNLSIPEQDALTTRAIGSYLQNTIGRKRTYAQDAIGSIVDMVPYMAIYGGSNKIAKGATSAIGLAGKATTMPEKIGVGVLESAIQTLIQPSSINQAIQNINGQTNFDVDNEGKIIYTGQDSGMSFGKAIGKAFVANMVENTSEKGGEVLDIWGNGLRNMLNKKIPQLGRAITSYQNTGVHNLMGAAGFNSLPSEFLEEQFATIGHAVAGDGQGNWKDLIDPRQQLLTATSILAIGSAAGVVSIPQIAARKIQIGKINTAAKKAEQFFDTQFTGENQEINNYIKNKIKNGTLAEQQDVLKTVFEDDFSTENQKKAVYDLFKANLLTQGMRGAEKQMTADNATALEQEGRTVFEKAQQKPNAGTMFAINKKVNEMEAKLGDEFAFMTTDELIDYLDTEDLIPEKKQEIENYLGERSVLNGAIQAMNDQAQQEINQIHAEIDNTTREDGTRLVVQTPVVNNEHAQTIYITDGNIALDDNGNIVRADSDTTLVGITEQGEPVELTINDISKASYQDAKEAKDKIAEDITNRYAQQFSQEAETNPIDVKKQEGAEIQWFENGKPHQGIVIDKAEGVIRIQEGKKIVLKNETELNEQIKNPNVQYHREDIIPLFIDGEKYEGEITADADADGKYSVHVSGYPGKKNFELTADEITAMQTAPVADETAPVQSDITSDKTSANEDKNATISTGETKQNVREYPKNKKGEIDFDKMDIATTFDYLKETEGEDVALEGLELSLKSVQKKIAANIKAVQDFDTKKYAELKKAETIQEQAKIRAKQKETAERLSAERIELDKQKAELQGLLPQVQAPVQQPVNEVKEQAVQEQPVIEDETEDSPLQVESVTEQQPTVTPEPVKHTVDLTGSKAVREKTKSTNVTDNQKRLKALGDYINLDDYILRTIAEGMKFSWKDKDGSKGLGSEFRYEESERKARFNILSADGATPEEFAHAIYELSGSYEIPGLSGMDWMDILNEVHYATRMYTSTKQCLEAAEAMRNVEEMYGVSEEELNNVTEEEMNAIPDEISDEEFFEIIGIANFTPEQQEELYNLINEYNEPEQTIRGNEAGSQETDSPQPQERSPQNEETGKEREITPSYSNGDTVTYKGKQYEINGIGKDEAGTVIYDLELNGKTVFEDVAESELGGDAKVDAEPKQKPTKAEIDARLAEERKQRILSEGTGYDKPFELIPVSEIKSAADIQANIEKIISTLKSNEGNKSFDLFKGFAYGGKYSKNAGEQIREYFISIDVLPPELRKEFVDNIGVTTIEELVNWGEKQYNNSKSEQPSPTQKQPWEMTREEIGKSYSQELKKIDEKFGRTININSKTKQDVFKKLQDELDNHKAIIQQALSEGKQVPENVLADYPELKKEEVKPEIKNEIPISEDGLYQIYEYKTKDETLYGVPSPYNKGLRGYGDDLFNTIEQAIKGAEYNRFEEVRLEKIRLKRIEEKKQEELDRIAELERKEANKGKSKIDLMNEGKYDKILDTKLNYDGVIMTRREFITKLINDGATIKAVQAYAIKDKSRTEWNRMDGFQQEAFEKRQKEAGKKTEYEIHQVDGSYYTITKAEYNLAESLLKQSKPIPTPEQPTKQPPLSREPKEVLQERKRLATEEKNRLTKLLSGKAIDMFREQSENELEAGTFDATQTNNRINELRAIEKELDAQIKLAEQAEKKGVEEAKGQQEVSFEEEKPVEPKSIEDMAQEAVKPKTKVASINLSEPKSDIQKIEDVGEKIGGAKKDRYSEYKDKITGATDDDIINQPLSKSFPRPDLKSMVEDGKISQDNAILMNYLYDNIPSKPRKSWQLRGWVEKVKAVISAFNQFMETKNLSDDFLSSLTGREKEAYEIYHQIHKQLNFPASDVKLGTYSIKKDSYFSGKYQVVQNTSGGYYVKGKFDTLDEAIKGLSEILGKPKTEKTPEFSIYRLRKNGLCYITPKGKANIILQDGFLTAEDAQNYLISNKQDLIDKFNAMKDLPDERRESNRERIGVDYRQGKDVQADDFRTVFGFRGVEFGNWVNQEERKQSINEAYDALMDLSTLLNITPKAISLGGKLGFAFGARGGGKYSAHYESDKVVINLTKTKGAGCVAHEWFHALDNYLSTNRGEKHGYLTEKPYKTNGEDQTRPELIDTFNDLMKAINKSGMAERSATIDNLKSKKYWSTSLEMGARAFENYVVDKLYSKGLVNDYLANFKTAGEYAIEADNRTYPYPFIEEGKLINEKFDNLFNTIQEDANGAMFQAVSPIGFYSTVEKALESINQEKGTKEQFKQMLLKNGAKQAEMDWMGFDELPEKLTKTDIQNWIDENRIEVEEVQKGNYSNRNLEAVKVEPFVYNVVDTKNGEVVLSNVSQSRADEFIDNAHDGTNTKFSQYVLPGGKNYKELLLTMPNKEVDYTKIEKQFGLYELSEELYNKNYDDLSVKELVGLKDEFSKRNPEKVQEYSEQLRKAREKENNKFSSAHFDEPNILAHIRFDERRVGGDTRNPNYGKRVLFIEEFQSDWAQKGKKEGFGTPKYTIKDVTIAKNGLSKVGNDNNSQNYFIRQRRNDFVVESTSGINVAEFDNIEKAKIFVVEKENQRQEQLKLGIPDMPFKKTDQWVNLAARRMMRYAAENGFDRIAWTNGEQQADRYDLSKQINQIDYRHENENSIWVDVFDKDDRRIESVSQRYAHNELESTFGKDVANKIINRENLDEEGGNIGSLTGVDLKVGGEGMKAFYDQIVPSAMSKLGKPFGAKVESIDLGINPKTENNNPLNATVQLYSEGMDLSNIPGSDYVEQGDYILTAPATKFIISKDDASSEEDAIEKYYDLLEENGDYVRPKYNSSAVQSIPVTNLMKETAMAGMPLFQSFSNKYDNATTSEERYNAAVEIAKELDAQNETSTIVAKNNEDFISMLPIQYADFVRNNRIGAVLYNGTLIINYVNQINADAIRIAHEHENTHIANNEVHTKADLSKLWDNVPESERRLVSKVYEKMEQSAKGDELIAYAVEDIIKKQGYENYKNGNIDLSLYSQPLQAKLKKTIDYANNKYLANNEGRTKISGSTNKGTNERFQQVNGEGTSTRKRGTANGTDKLPETIEVNGVERSTTNSLGKPIHSTEEGIRNFWKWFGDSKVVDESGRPLVVYHGSRNGEFNVFDQSKGNPVLGGGMYFSNSKNISDKFAGTKGNIFEVYLKIENPNYGTFNGSGADMQNSEYRDGGIFTKNNTDKYANKGDKEYIVFSPTQIKSATGNDGSFDGNDSDIRFQIIGEQGAANLDKAEEATTRLDNLRVAKEMEVTKTEKQDVAIRNSFNYRGTTINQIENIFWNPGQAIGDDFNEDFIYVSNGFVNAVKEGLTPLETISVLDKNKKGEWHHLFTKNEDGSFDTKYVKFSEPKQFTPLEIRLATGWEKGVDGKWRYETTKHSVHPQLQDYIDKSADGFVKWVNARRNNGLPVTLIDIFGKDDETLKALPQLSKIAVRFSTNAEMEGSTGIFNPFDNEIILNTRIANNAEKIFSVLEHEVQHGVQRLEGFAQGSNNEMGAQASAAKRLGFESYDAYIKELKKQEDEIAKLQAEYEEAESAPLYNIKKGIRAIKLEGQLNDMRETISKLQLRTEDLQNSYKSYYNAAGEVEARNMQRRMNFTDEEKRNTLLAETAGVSPEDQIIIMEGLGASMSMTEDEVQAKADKIKREGLKSIVPDYTKFLSNVLKDCPKRKDVVKQANELGWNMQKAIEDYMAEFATKGTSKAEMERVMKLLGLEDFSKGEVKMILWENANPNDGTTEWKAKRAIAYNNAKDNSIPKFPTSAQIAEYEDSIGNLKLKGMAKVKNFIFRFEESYMNQLASMRKFMEIIEKLGDIPDKYNPYYLSQLRTSAAQTSLERYEKKEYKGLMEAVSNLNKELKKANGLIYLNKDYKSEKGTIDRATLYSLAKAGLGRNERLAREEAAATYKEVYAALEAKYKEGLLEETEYNNKLVKIQQAEAKLAKKLNETNDYGGLTGLSDLVGSGAMDFKDVRKVVEDIVAEAEKTVNTKAFWETVKKATSYSLKYQYDRGMMTKQMYEHVLNLEPYYLPLRGYDEETAADLYEYFTSNKGNFNPVLKKAKGHAHLPENPFAHLLSMTASGIMQAENNKVKIALLNLVENNKNDIISIKDTWVRNIGTEEEPEWVEAYPQIPIDATSEEVIQALEDFETQMQALKAENRATIKSNKLRLTVPIGKGVKSEHAITVKRNGQENTLYVNGNPRLAQAINGMLNPDTQDMSKVLKFAKSINRGMSANFTSRNLEFAITNTMRDIHMAAMLSAIEEGIGYSAKLVKNVAVCQRTLASNLFGSGTKGKYQDYLNEYLENGGQTGFVVLRTIETYNKDVEKLKRSMNKRDALAVPKWIFKQIGDINNMAEQITRFATYVTSREEGRTPVRSAIDAKNITLNFNQKGSGEMGAGWMQSLFLFFNPAMQALYRANQARQKHPARFWSVMGLHGAAGAMIPALAFMMIALIAGDDDDKLEHYQQAYWNTPEWIRRNNLMIWVPGTTHFVKIPLGQELRWAYSIGEIGLTKAMGQEKYGSSTGKQALESVSALLPVDIFGASHWYIPGFATPVYEAKVNENFMGKPIYKETPFNTNDPEWTKAYKNTWGSLTSISKKINELSGGDDVSKGKIDINPAITQHLIEGYLGGLVSVYLRGGEQIGKAFSGEEISMNDIPIARRVYSIADKQVYDNSTRREYFDIYNDLKKGVDHKLQKYNKIVNEYDARFNKGEETPTQEDLERWGLYLDKLNKLKQTKDYYKLKEYKAAEKAQKLWEKEGTPFDEANLMKQVVDNVKLIDDAEAAKRVKAEAEAEAQTEEEITD